MEEQMDRKYTTGFYEELITRIRKKIPDIAITTDVMMEFPTETEENFENSCDFISKLKFARIHIFTYSPRQGTQAQGFLEVDERIKKERYERMFELAKEEGMNYRRQFLSKILEVLVERKEKDGYLSGLSSNYIRVFFKGEDKLKNNIVSVKIDKVGENSVFGEVVN